MNEDVWITFAINLHRMEV